MPLFSIELELGSRTTAEFEFDAESPGPDNLGILR
jgi:hypothetical protein